MNFDEAVTIVLGKIQEELEFDFDTDAFEKSLDQHVKFFPGDNYIDLEKFIQDSMPLEVSLEDYRDITLGILSAAGSVARRAFAGGKGGVKPVKDAAGRAGHWVTSNGRKIFIAGKGKGGVFSRDVKRAAQQGFRDGASVVSKVKDKAKAAYNKANTTENKNRAANAAIGGVAGAAATGAVIAPKAAYDHFKNKKKKKK
jgi:hypothetical protein